MRSIQPKRNRDYPKAAKAIRQMLRDRVRETTDDDYDWRPTSYDVDDDGWYIDADYEAVQRPPSPWTAMVMAWAKG